MKNYKTAKALIESYEKNPFPRDHVASMLPSNKKIKRIIIMSRDIIMPNYFGKNLPKYRLFHDAFIKWRIKSLHRILKRQISLAMLYLSDSKEEKKARKTSCRLCTEYIDRFPQIREYLRLDLEAHYNGDPAAFNRDEIIVSYPGFYAIMIYRLAHEMRELNIPMIPRMMSEFAHRETGIDINPGAKIGKSFFIDHGTGIVIGETSIIGDNVKMYQGVTLGAMSTRGGQALKGIRRHPVIGNNVTIYSNASILGKDAVIGDDATIGSNVFITNAIPKGAKVIAMLPTPAVTIKNKGDDDNASQGKHS